MMGNQARTALLHLPATLDPGRKYPLVLGLHGGLGNAKGYIEHSQLLVKGERAGFIVVCPEGTAVLRIGDHRVWNSGPEYATAPGNADDVSFMRELIGKIRAQYPIDPKRIYVTGFSNGAQMAYRLALNMSDEIAAIAPMSGARLAGDLQPSHPIPVLHIHGTADGYYPIEGGRGPYSMGRIPHVPVESVIAEWSRLNGAAVPARLVVHNGWEAEFHDGPAPVALVRVLGMGHQIAGGRDDRLPRQAMRSEPDAVAMALAFFAEH
jgi:polyhydroxybutyrate depolymerase